MEAREALARALEATLRQALVGVLCPSCLHPHDGGEEGCGRCSLCFARAATAAASLDAEALAALPRVKGARRSFGAALSTLLADAYLAASFGQEKAAPRASPPTGEPCSCLLDSDADERALECHLALEEAGWCEQHPLHLVSAQDLREAAHHMGGDPEDTLRHVREAALRAVAVLPSEDMLDLAVGVVCVEL
jgi:hypothetical protein